MAVTGGRLNVDTICRTWAEDTKIGKGSLPLPLKANFGMTPKMKRTKEGNRPCRGGERACEGEKKKKSWGK